MLSTGCPGDKDVLPKAPTSKPRERGTVFIWTPETHISTRFLKEAKTPAGGKVAMPFDSRSLVGTTSSVKEIEEGRPLAPVNVPVYLQRQTLNRGHAAVGCTLRMGIRQPPHVLISYHITRECSTGHLIRSRKYVPDWISFSREGVLSTRISR